MAVGIRIKLEGGTAEAVDRLIELYTALDKPDEVKKWKAEREKHAKRDETKSEQK